MDTEFDEALVGVDDTWENSSVTELSRLDAV